MYDCIQELRPKCQHISWQPHHNITSNEDVVYKRLSQYPKLLPIVMYGTHNLNSWESTAADCDIYRSFSNRDIWRNKRGCKLQKVPVNSHFTRSKSETLKQSKEKTVRGYVS